MKRILLILSALFVAASSPTSAEPVDMAKRTEELKSLRWGMFICWSFSTFSGREWTGGVTDVNFFKATGCDTDQWARTAKEASMGYILFLTKHHDGFCLWDTKTTDRKVTKAPLGRDVLAELKKSCDKHGIKLALYFSEGDWTWPGAADGKGWKAGVGRNPEMKKAQLKELLTQYGPVEYIWFDHAVGDGGLSHAETIAFCKSLQPGCFIGFNHGDQAGADIRLGEMGRPGPLDDHTAAGPHMKDAPSKSYRLAEFTYPILPPHQGGAMWFYSLPIHDGLCHPPEKLYRDYLGAVKYGNVFALDAGPDYAGRLREVDARTLRKVGEMIRSKAPLPAEASLTVDEAVNWQAFLAQHDLVWQTLPTKFDYGTFLGNGLLGTMIHRDGDNRLRFEMGRADVTEHRRDNARLPIGGLVLDTCGKIQDGTMRLDLWNAEVNGSVKTDKGGVTFRALIHTQEMAFFVELETSDGEKDAKFSWEAKPCVDHRNVKKFNDPPNPPSRNETAGDVQVCVQPRFAGGEFATAWKEITLDGRGAEAPPTFRKPIPTDRAAAKPAPFVQQAPESGRGLSAPTAGNANRRRVVLSIADSFPGNTARAEAVRAVEKNAAADFDRLVTSHRDWWHAFYPKSFVSIPDAKLESFYWIQLYKLACASRPDRVPVDLLGPWYRQTGWPRIWWNLNIQTLYLPVYAANHPELGESLVRFLDAKRANFARNAKELYGFDNCATVPHTTCYEGLRGDGTAAPDKFINPGDFTWALHNYYLQYRHTMDHAIVTDHARRAFYPLLRGSVNLYLRLLKKGDDGKLHLPVLHSPEYGDDADNNYNLALLRWACETLVALNARYKLDDSLLPKWRETLANLVAYPVDDHGLRIGATMAFEKSHRHWSHILMVHPLHITDCAEPKNRALIEKTVAHWLTVDGSRGVYGWSRAAAASLHAALGDGDAAIGEIHKHMADERFVRPNTMYIEGSPVIECSIVLGRSLQDMLLQSWGDTIRVFPAVPKTWTNAVFHNLSAEGAFLVSAERANGKLAWVRLKSLAGEPCRVKPGFDGEVKASVPMKRLGGGVFELALAKGEEALLFTGDVPPRPLVKPLPIAPAKRNQFGAKKTPVVKRGPISPDKDGRFILRAAEATIHGDTPRYESSGGKDQIGFWKNPADFVSWDIKLAKPAAFAVEITYSCASPGSEFTVEVGDLKLTGKSASTGSWAAYRTDKLGTLKFNKAGTLTLAVKPKTEPRWKIIGLKSVTLTPVAGQASAPADWKNSILNGPIKAFCVDFNWGLGGPNGFPKPGLWADADPAKHVAWYEQLGCNVIQTFAVSCNGYAWYQGGKVPAQPGLKHDFTTQVVKLGHAKKMLVMGYFCINANTLWGQQHPDLSYGFPSAYHIPFTDAYLDYLAASIGDAVHKTGMDGFMIDWVWCPTDAVRKKEAAGKWLESEKKLYEQLTAKAFPGEEKLTAEERLAYERKAIDRCWTRIRDAAKRANPACVIWLSCNKVSDPAIAGSPMLKEVDWMMDEAGTPAAMKEVAPMFGAHTRQLLCLAGWGDRHKTREILSDPAMAAYGIYGFSKPNPDSLPLPVATYLGRPIESFKGNDRGIATLARYFTGKPFDFVAQSDLHNRGGEK